MTSKPLAHRTCSTCDKWDTYSVHDDAGIMKAECDDTKKLTAGSEKCSGWELFIPNKDDAMEKY